MASIQHRGKRWRAVIRRAKRPTMIQSFPRKADAETWARHVESQFDRGIVAEIKAARMVTMAELFDRYATATQGSKRNAPHERFTLRLLSQHLGEFKLAELGVQDVVEFRDMRLADGRSAATVVNNLHLLSAVVQMAITEWGFEIAYNPVRKVRKPRVNNARDRRLEPGELDRLLAAADELEEPEMRTLVILGVRTAMRIGELLALEWTDIDWDKRQAYLPMTKNGEVRKVPLDKQAAAALQALGSKKSGKVITKWKNVHSFVRPWHRLVRKAGIRGLNFHDLRHEAASRMAENGMSLLQISAITGHKSFSMLKRYTHFKTADLAAELDKID